jgi:hypothetical protein
LAVTRAVEVAAPVVVAKSMPRVTPVSLFGEVATPVYVIFSLLVSERGLIIKEPAVSVGRVWTYTVVSEPLRVNPLSRLDT